MNQRDAVYNATMSVLSENGVEFEDFGNISDVMTKELRDQVHTIVCESFTSGKVSFQDTPANAEKMSNPTKLSSYVSGLISNWYRKDKRFNGNTVYTPKNPGSRTGQGDAQLKALRALHKQYNGVDADQAAKIQAAIDTRVAELQAEKAKANPIDYSAIPAELLSDLGIDQE